MSSNSHRRSATLPYGENNAMRCPFPPIGDSSPLPFMISSSNESKQQHRPSSSRPESLSGNYICASPLPHRENIRNLSVMKGAELVRAEILAGGSSSSLDKMHPRKETPSRGSHRVKSGRKISKQLMEMREMESQLRQQQILAKKMQQEMDCDKSSSLSSQENKTLDNDRRSSPARFVQPNTLLNDQAYLHAVRAGLLWQTLVGEFVRFPPTWFDGKRTPPMGASGTVHWNYLSKSRIRSPLLTKLIPSPKSAGRILLHLVIQDLMTWTPTVDIALGGFHPHAKGIKPNDQDKDVRLVWMAVRKRTTKQKEDASLIDFLLGQKKEDVAQKSPLGDKRNVGNSNIRSVFGDEPPLETVIVLESDLYRMMQAVKEDPTAGPMSPANLLLSQFLFRKRNHN